MKCSVKQQTIYVLELSTSEMSYLQNLLQQQAPTELDKEMRLNLLSALTEDIKIDSNADF